MSENLSRQNDDRRWNLIGGLLFVVIGVLHLAFLSRHSLQNNEFITLQVILLDYPTLIRERLDHNHMPGYFMMLKAWSTIFGQSEAALRFPSALAALAGIVLVWRMGAAVFGRKFGLLALALAGFNQVHVQEGYDARMYSILFFTATASLWATLRHLDRGGKRYLFALAAAGIIGLGFHMLYLFVSLVLAIWLIQRRRDYPQAWRRLLLALCAPIVFLLALMTVWMEAQNKIGHADEWGKFQLTNAFRQMFMIFTGDYHALHFKPTQYLGLFAVLVCMILTLSHLWRRRARRTHGDPGGADPHRFDGLFWLWCLLPTLLIAIGGLRSHRQLVGSWRYYIMIGSAAPLLMCSAAMLMRDARRERLAWIFSLGFAGIVFLNAVAFLVQPKLGLRAVVHHVSEEYRPSDLVLVSDHKSRSYGFVYYGLLGQKPAERPKEARHSKEILDWIDQQMTGHDRLWAVFYDDLDDDRLFKALSKAEARYKPQGPIFSHGGTRVGLYRRSPSFVPIKLSK